MHASTCKTCDMSFCDGRTCVVFNESAPVKATGSAKKLVYYLRLYAKEKKLSNMKGVRPPDDWFKAQRDIKAKKQKSDKQAKQPDKGAHPVVPVDGDDDDAMDEQFWETLDAAHSPSVFMAAHEVQVVDESKIEDVEDYSESAHTDEHTRVASSVDRVDANLFARR
ncbi:hypothetical protein AB1Y20_019349 [Prymnesium parvum]|uniref:Uncharacterized protein n=1 Tax=Prymnesium parvum TaxID=97485 RepID=A0AB34JVN2_PRYPA